MQELQLMLAALTQLGEAGKEAFIWWLIFDKLIPGIIVLIVLLSLLWFILIIIRLTTLAAKLRDAMNVGSPGPVTENESREMLKWIRDHAKNS